MEGESPQQEVSSPSPDNSQSKAWNKKTKSKQGADRRMKVKTQNFDKNLHRKLDGEEIPKTYRVSNRTFFTHSVNF